MEKNFIRVRSLGDIAISVIILIIGCFLMILPDSNGVRIAGFMIELVGFLLLWTMKTSYKDESTGEIFRKKERYFSQSQHEQLQKSLISPAKFCAVGENEGSTLRLDIYYNNSKVLIQLLEYVPYTYEPCSKMHEHTFDKAKKLIR